jgi:phage terminase small subunit
MVCPKGKGGPKPGTNREKKIFGVKKDRINFNEPERIAEMPTLPDEISALILDEGKTFFTRTATMLFNNGTLSKSDESSLFLLATTFQDWLREYKKCREQGRHLPVMNADGKIISVYESSYSKVERQLFDRFLSMLKEFGMTPTARSAVLKAGSKGDDFLEIKPIT